MKYDNQLRYAVNIIKDYDGKLPLSVWLKDFFRNNRQMGSRDRRTVSELVYGFYRLGHTPFDSIEERVLSALALTNDQSNELVAYFKPLPLPVSSASIFPWADLLSEGIDSTAFSLSFLKQPDLFLRLRPGKQKPAFKKLEAAGIPYSSCGESCIRLANGTNIDTILRADDEVVIQDMNSQRIGAFFHLAKRENSSAKGYVTTDKSSATGKMEDAVMGEKSSTASAFLDVWDCCAASGGKSILAKDILGKINLTVSDVRTSIINNLHARFREAGIKNYRSFVADLTEPGFQLPDNKYDLIIADVPCSGSGTWARTPEQLYFFREEKIDYYNSLQQKIVSKVIPALRPGGILIYITCSVFKKENEAVVNFIKEKHNLFPERMELLKGYNDRADSMFAAAFINYGQSSLT